MDNETAMALSRYLVYLMDCPQTRKNNSLIDCTMYLLQERPDTDESLAASLEIGGMTC